MTYAVAGKTLSIGALGAVADFKTRLGVGAKQVADDLVVDLKHAHLNAEAPVTTALRNALRNTIIP